jgi:hypothetical protein
MSSDLTFVVRKNDKGWIIRSQSILGEGSIGLRLAKGTGLPDIGIQFKTKSEADLICEKWKEWYHGQPYLKKKQKALKYIA